MIDTHAHVHDQAFEADRAEIIARARAAGVTGLVVVGTDLADSARAILVAHEFGTAVAVGIHPHEAAQAPADLPAAFAPLLASADHLVAIGEIGLDYHYEHSPREIQQQVLRAQLLLADHYDLPLIFHEREALDDFISILRAENTRRGELGRKPLQGVIHCFTRDLAAAKIYTEEFGLKLGIGGVLTFKTAQALREAVSAVGLAAIILETDCPYLAPVPYRGQRNEPAFVAATAQKLAELLGCSLAEVLAVTTENARALFGSLPTLYNS